MAYGHMSMFFATAAEAQEYLDNCRTGGNYTAENYQDRVNAQRCIRQAEGWAPAPLPPVTRLSKKPPEKRKRATHAKA